MPKTKKTKRSGAEMSTRSFKTNTKRSWAGNRRWQAFTLVAVVVLAVGAIGVKNLGQSHANGTWYFWATRQGNVWSSPWLCGYDSYGNPRPCGWNLNDNLPVGYWPVSCQYRTNWTKSYGGYSNDWWVRLSDNQGEFSARWVNEVFLSANTSGPGGSAPGIRICENS